MIDLTSAHVKAAGGVLAALADRSVEYVHSLIKSGIKPIEERKLRRLGRVIVHTDPHLDEYLADLIFRACLPREKWGCEFVEQSLFSSAADLGCKHLWPAAAVMGIGRSYGGGEPTVFMYDEHIPVEGDQLRRRLAPSCSQLVADQMTSNLPASIKRVLNEVNIIDESGGAHEQSLANLIKTLHDVRLNLGHSSGRQVIESMSPEWKRTVVDACLVAVIYCLENKVDVDTTWAKSVKIISASLEHYIKHSAFSGHSAFAETVQRFRAIYSNQGPTYRDAILTDKKGASVAQVLILGKLALACDAAWGAKIRDLLIAHFLEGEFQNQLGFFTIQREFDNLRASGATRATTPVGTLSYHVLSPIQLGPHAVATRRHGRPEAIPKQASPWILTITVEPEYGKANRAIGNYLNRKNYGCGLYLIRNSVLGTNALFKGNAIPPEQWLSLANAINTLEQGRWFVMSTPQGTIAPWIINGNKAHQYVPRSALDEQVLVELAKRHLR